MRLREFCSADPQGQESGAPPYETVHDESLIDQDLRYKQSRWTPKKGRDPWLELNLYRGGYPKYFQGNFKESKG